MISPSRKNRSILTSSKPEEISSFEFIKAYELVGLSASNVIPLGNSIEEKFSVTPNVIISDAGLHIYFDFNAPPVVPTSSTPTSAIQRQQIVQNKISFAFFGNFTNGDQFKLTDAKYDFGTYNLGGTYTFHQYINNVVVATGVTIEEYVIGRYARESFNYTPVFTSSTTKSTTLPKNTFRIVNLIGSKSLNTFNPIKTGDILEISEIKYTVISKSVDIYDREHIIIAAHQLDEVLPIPTLLAEEKNIINLYRIRN